VLGTDVGGTREIIENGETGVLARPGAPAELAEGLALLLSDAGRVMARRAQAQARVRFSPARFAADLDHCYRELAGTPVGRSP
jgi:glycosyltransferase involved in cell wall biosynthesis